MSEKLEAELGDCPEDPFSGDPGGIPNPRDPSRRDHKGTVSLQLSCLSWANSLQRNSSSIICDHFKLLSHHKCVAHTVQTCEHFH